MQALLCIVLICCSMIHQITSAAQRTSRPKEKKVCMWDIQRQEAELRQQKHEPDLDDAIKRTRTLYVRVRTLKHKEADSGLEDVYDLLDFIEHELGKKILTLRKPKHS